MSLSVARVVRIVQVTLALSGAGAVVGAVLGVAPIAVIALIVGGYSGMSDTVEVWPGMAAICGSLGALLGPILSWLLLRRVPIGKAILHCAIGTMPGAVVGVFLPTNRDYNLELEPIMTAVIGAVYAAVRLRVRDARRASVLPRAVAPDTTEAVRPQRDSVR